MKDLLNSGRISIINERARAITPVDAAHDFTHMERVSQMAMNIFSEEIREREQRDATREELECCAAAALLHDCVPIAKNSPLRKESSRLSSEKAAEWLKEWGWSAAEIEVIAGAVLDHSFSSGRTPRTLVGEALQDADRLESLGAMGLYRTIATGVAMGAELFDAQDPWAESRELDDKKYSVDHFFTKLLKLPETFRTRAAREEALMRADYLRGFLAQLQRELGR